MQSGFARWDAARMAEGFRRAPVTRRQVRRAQLRRQSVSTRSGLAFAAFGPHRPRGSETHTPRIRAEFAGMELIRRLDIVDQLGLVQPR